MKAKLIIANWVFSFMGLMVVEPFWAEMCGAGWFMASCGLLVLADRKGWTKEFLESKAGKFINPEE